MKKILAIILTMLLCFQSIPAFCKSGDFILRVDNKEAKPGEKVEVDFVLENNPGVLAMILVMDYDNDRLKLVDTRDGGLIAGPVFGNDYSKKPFKFLWASASDRDFDEDGTLVTVTFEVLEDAPLGKAEIRIKHQAKNILNFDLNQVPMTTVNGSVNVVSGGESEPEDIPEEPEEDGDSFTLKFDDVTENDWFYSGVKFVNEKGWMSGVGSNTFAPTQPLTRGMVVSIMHRIAGSPECGQSDFEDVNADNWYSKGVAWASETGIVSGVGEGKFAPDADVTREQIAVILYNFAKMFGVDVSIGDSMNGFIDASEISTWAKDAVSWAVGAKLISGKDNGMVDPQGKATRAEIATILCNISNIL